MLVIYYQNVRSYGAGMLTVLSKRIGDVALLMVIAWTINFSSWSFIYYLEFISGSVEIELISFLFFQATKAHSGPSWPVLGWSLPFTFLFCVLASRLMFHLCWITSSLPLTFEFYLTLLHDSDQSPDILGSVWLLRSTVTETTLYYSHLFSNTVVTSRMCNLYVSTVMRKHILYSVPFSFAFLIRPKFEAV